MPGRGSSLRKQEPLTFPPNNKATAKIKGGVERNGEQDSPPALGKQVHPPQTISFLLLFVEFRNKTKQNNTPCSLGWGSSRDGQATDKTAVCQPRDSKETEFSTKEKGRRPDCQAARNLGQVRRRRPKGATSGCDGGPPLAAVRVNEARGALLSPQPSPAA